MHLRELLLRQLRGGHEVLLVLRGRLEARAHRDLAHTLPFLPPLLQATPLARAVPILRDIFRLVELGQSGVRLVEVVQQRRTVSLRRVNQMVIVGPIFLRHRLQQHRVQCHLREVLLLVDEQPVFDLLAPQLVLHRLRVLLQHERVSRSVRRLPLLLHGLVHHLLERSPHLRLDHQLHTVGRVQYLVQSLLVQLLELVPRIGPTHRNHVLRLGSSQSEVSQLRDQFTHSRRWVLLHVELVRAGFRTPSTLRLGRSRASLLELRQMLQHRSHVVALDRLLVIFTSRDHMTILRLDVELPVVHPDGLVLALVGRVR